jgi:deoxyribodipyrimidine photolyase-related protein
MSNYCKSCRYDVKQTTGPTSCPMNALYWSFLDRHRDKLAGNRRMAQMYRTWEKMTDEKRATLLETADASLPKLDNDKPGAL